MQIVFHQHLVAVDVLLYPLRIELILVLLYPLFAASVGSITSLSLKEATRKGLQPSAFIPDGLNTAAPLSS